MKKSILPGNSLGLQEKKELKTIFFNNTLVTKILLPPVLENELGSHDKATVQGLRMNELYHPWQSSFTNSIHSIKILCRT